MASGYTPTGGAQAEASWMNSVEKRLAVMETQQRLVNSSVRGGAMVVYDDELKQVWRAGRFAYSTTSGSVQSEGMSINNKLEGENGFLLLIDSKEGWVVPQLRTNMVSTESVSTTSAGPINLFRGQMNVLGAVVRASFTIGAPSGTTVRGYLRMGQVDAEDYYEVSDGTIRCDYSWDIRDFTSINGGAIDAAVRVERVSGSGNVYAFAPDYIHFTTLSGAVDATKTGAPA